MVDGEGACAHAGRRDRNNPGRTEAACFADQELRARLEGMAPSRSGKSRSRWRYRIAADMLRWGKIAKVATVEELSRN